MIGRHEFLHRIVRALFAKHNKAVQALLLQRLNKTLDEGIRIRGSIRGNFHLGPRCLERSVERLSILRLQISHEGFHFDPLGFGMLQKSLDLLSAPLFIRVKRRSRDINLARLDVQKDQ